MASGIKNMDNKSDAQLLIMKATIESNGKYYNDKMNNIVEDLTADIASMMDKNQKTDSSPDKMDSPKSQDPTTVVPSNKKDPPLKVGHYTKIGGMWTLKHEISSPKIY